MEEKHLFGISQWIIEKNENTLNCWFCTKARRHLFYFCKCDDADALDKDNKEEVAHINEVEPLAQLNHQYEVVENDFCL
jgi:hypothetical protein